MKKKWLLGGVASALMIFTLTQVLAKEVHVFQYDSYFKLPERPFPTEYLIEVVKLEPTKSKLRLKIESIVQREYCQRLIARDRRKGSEVRIELTKEDFAEIGTPKAGDIYAAFGLDRGKKIIFRMDKYSGPREEAAIQKWFDSLKP